MYELCFCTKSEITLNERFIIFILVECLFIMFRERSLFAGKTDSSDDDDDDDDDGK